MWYLFSIHTLLNTRINWEKRRDGHVLPVGIHDLITDFTEASQASPRCLKHLSSLLKQLRDCFRSFSVVAPNCLTLYYLFLWFFFSACIISIGGQVVVTGIPLILMLWQVYRSSSAYVPDIRQGLTPGGCDLEVPLVQGGIRGRKLNINMYICLYSHPSQPTLGLKIESRINN